MSQSDKSSTTITYRALVGSFWLTLIVPFVWKWPCSNLEILLILSITILAAGAEICVIKALELSEASVVGPIHYTLIIWGVFYGYAVFGQIPDLWTWIGARIIISCGLYNVYQERQLMKLPTG